MTTFLPGGRLASCPSREAAEHMLVKSGFAGRPCWKLSRALFIGTKGSKTYRNFVEGRWVYRFFVLQKEL